MAKFIKNEQINYENDPLYNEINNLLAIYKTKIVGSYIKYGKDKVCDMDLNESVQFDYNNFHEYIQKIYDNKNKFKIIDLYLYKPYDKLQIIMDNLSELNGLFKLVDPIDINKIQLLINDLPKELKDPLNELFNNYINSNNTSDYIKVFYFMYDNLIPKWTLKELLKGNKKYYDQNYDLNIDKFNYFFIEMIYKNFRVSGYINFIENQDINKKYVIIPMDDLLMGNRISYYKMIKKLGFFIKWLQYNIKKNDNNIKIFNDLFKFRENIGKEYNETCLIKNKIDLYKLKLTKYKNKKIKHNNTKYDKHISKYEQLIEKYKKEFNEKYIIIDNKSKSEYEKLVDTYGIYMKDYIRIK